jgi:hypothetical protein
VPKIDLTPAESLLVTLLEAEVQGLRKRASELMDEANQKITMGVQSVCESHKEPAPGPGLNFSFEHDDRGRPTRLSWEKPA